MNNGQHEEQQLQLRRRDLARLQILFGEFDKAMNEAAQELGNNGRTIQEVSAFLSPLTAARNQLQKINEANQ